YHGNVRKNEGVWAIRTGAEAFRGVVERWIEQGQADKLVELWVKGLSLDWERLYGEPKPRRLSLPTYPFARDRYWVPAASGRIEDPAARALSHRRDSETPRHCF